MLIKESGEGLPNANAYADDATASTYCETRGLAWDEPLETREIALIRATDFIDTNYVFRSVRNNLDQGLESPRYGQTGLPQKLVKATIELAVIALTTDIFALPDTKQITSVTESVAGLSSSTSYQISTGTDPYPTITRLLSGVATRRGATASWFMVTP